MCLCVVIHFEGVFQKAQVYINGVFKFGDQDPGYNGFSIRLDTAPALKYGTEENIVAIYVDGGTGSGWWYEGAGIFRHVYLISTSSTHIEQDGVFAPATIDSADIIAHVPPARAVVVDNSAGLVAAAAVVHASATVVGPAPSVSVTFTLYDGDNAVAHGASAPAAAAAAAAHNATLRFSGAKLWSVGSPQCHLYTLVSEVVGADKKILDSVNTSVRPSSYLLCAFNYWGRFRVRLSYFRVLYAKTY